MEMYDRRSMQLLYENLNMEEVNRQFVSPAFIGLVIKRRTYETQALCMHSFTRTMVGDQFQYLGEKSMPSLADKRYNGSQVFYSWTRSLIWKST